MHKRNYNQILKENNNLQDKSTTNEINFTKINTLILPKLYYLHIATNGLKENNINFHFNGLKMKKYYINIYTINIYIT